MVLMRAHQALTSSVSLSFSPWKTGTFVWSNCMTGPIWARILATTLATRDPDATGDSLEVLVVQVRGAGAGGTRR